MKTGQTVGPTLQEQAEKIKKHLSEKLKIQPTNYPQVKPQDLEEKKDKFKKLKPILNTFSEQFRIFRTELLNLSQKDLKKSFSVSLGYFSEMEKGRIIPQLEIHMILHLMGFNLVRFLTGEGPFQSFIPNFSPKNLGERIRFSRENLKLSEHECAEKLEITPHELYCYENSLIEIPENFNNTFSHKLRIYIN